MHPFLVAARVAAEYHHTPVETSRMATVMQHEELVRRALNYIVERRRECPGMGTAELLDSAGARFNLSPLDQKALERLLELQSGEDRA